MAEMTLRDWCDVIDALKRDAGRADLATKVDAFVASMVEANTVTVPA